jgi:hypothetical protein
MLQFLPGHVEHRLEARAQRIEAVAKAQRLVVIVQHRDVGNASLPQVLQQTGGRNARKVLAGEPRHAIVQQLEGLHGAIVAEEVVRPS